MLTDLWFRLRALFRRGAKETELDQELRFHFENQVEKYEKAGMAHEDAVRRERLSFGGQDPGTGRLSRSSRGMHSLPASTQGAGGVIPPASAIAASLFGSGGSTESRPGGSQRAGRRIVACNTAKGQTLVTGSPAFHGNNFQRPL